MAKKIRCMGLILENQFNESNQAGEGESSSHLIDQILALIKIREGQKVLQKTSFIHQQNFKGAPRLAGSLSNQQHELAIDLTDTQIFLQMKP